MQEFIEFNVESHFYVTMSICLENSQMFPNEIEHIGLSMWDVVLFSFFLNYADLHFAKLKYL